MAMTYRSNNGLTGVFEKGNFFGFKHYDLTIFKTDTKEMLYHATYTEPITFEELKKQVDELPDFLERLEKLRRIDNDKSRKN